MIRPLFRPIALLFRYPGPGLLLLAGLCLCPAAETAKAGPSSRYEVAPVPEWVVPVEADLKKPAPFEKNVNSGFYFRLVDLQSHAEKEQFFHHYADEFLNTAGISDYGDIEIEYDPAFETLTLHHVTLCRGDERIDVLDEANIRFVNLEEDWPSGMVNGHVTLFVFLKDLRVGDVVDYAYTISGSNPCYAGKFLDSVPLQWATTVRQSYYRLVKSRSRRVYVKSHHTEIEPQVETLEGHLEALVYRQTDVEPLILENNIPEWYQPHAWVQLSEFEDWNELAQWAATLYDFPSEAPDPGLRQLVEQIRQAHANPEDRALAALAFVQNDVRYLGLEEGPGAYRPSPPNETFRRRFGDCKDKVALLQALLAELEIDSQPVLLSMSGRGRVAEWHPSPFAFDHVILRISLPDGETVWADPTQTHQEGTLKQRFFDDYGKGLVVDAKTEDLIDMPECATGSGRVKLVEDFYVGDVGESSRVEASTQYSGQYADSFRYYLESTEVDLIRQNHLDYYQENFPQARAVSDPGVTDRRKNNRLTVDEEYELDQIWTADGSGDGYHYIYFYFDSVRNRIRQPVNVRRTMPYALEFPQSLIHTIRVHLPSELDWDFDDEDVSIEENGLRYTRKVHYADHLLTLVATYETLQDHIAPENTAAYRKTVERILELTSYSVWRYRAEDDLTLTGGGDGAAGSELGSMLATGLGIQEDMIRPLAIGVAMLLAFVMGGATAWAVAATLRGGRERNPAVPVSPFGSAHPFSSEPSSAGPPRAPMPQRDSAPPDHA